MDENVHFTHTVSLIKALIEAGKPYDLQVFPVERHLLKNSMSCESYMTYVLSYLQLNLWDEQNLHDDWGTCYNLVP